MGFLVLFSVLGAAAPAMAQAAMVAANDLTVNVDYNQRADFTVTGSGDGALTYSLKTAPTKGTVVLGSTGAGSYTPMSGASGTDSFDFRVTDSLGQEAVGTVTLTIAEPAPAPVVRSVSVPASGQYRAGDILAFVVEFDQAVTVTGTPVLSLSLDASTKNAAYLSQASASLIFRYTIQSGDAAPSGIAIQSLNLNGGTIRNAEGTSASLMLNNVGNTSGIVVDALAPALSATQAAAGTASDATTIHFTATFSEAVTGVSVTDFILTTTGTVAGMIESVSGSGTTYDVTVSSVSGVGTLRLDGSADGNIKDAMGNRLTTRFSGGTPWARILSGNANLSALAPSAGALNPAFSPAVTSYTATIGNAVTAIALTPTVADSKATVTVDGHVVGSGSASGAIALAVGSTAVAVVVTAQDGTTRTYTVTVVRAPSGDAALATLAPSSGTLSPAFDPATLAYTIAVGNEVTSLTLTPGAADANAAITVAGRVVASGSASQPVALAVGTTSVPVVVTAQDGTTQVTYSVRVTRTGLAPSVVSRTVEVHAGETAVVDLTEGATGGPFTGAGIVAAAAAKAGTARVEGAGGRYRLVFASDPRFSGAANIGFTLSNAIGPSAPGTIAFSVIARPDPSRDSEVQGLLKAQAESAKRLVRTQTRNFNNRLEQLHREGDRRRSSLDLRMSLGDGEDSMDPGLRALLGENERTSGEEGGPLNDWAAFPSPSRVRNAAPAAPSAASDAGGGPNLGRYALWSGGYVNFGERDGAGLDLSSTTVGVSGGIDYRFAPDFVAGLGLGYGHDAADIGAHGTRNRATAYSGAAYASYRPVPSLFLDALVGGSWLDFEATRFVTANGGMAAGTRDGQQLFGSLTAAYDVRNKAWLVSPYGRLEMSRSWLDGYTEEGGGLFALAYGDQSIDTLSGILGLRAEYSFDMSWGRLSPGLRVEYTHDFEGSSRVALGYADMDVLAYSYEIEPSGRDHATLGLSLDAETRDDWSIGLDYRTTFDRDERNHTLGAKVGRHF